MSKPWNTGDELLKKFIGNSPDGEIEMGTETWSGHEGPRLSIEAQWRLEICRGVVGMTYLMSLERSRQTEIVVRNLTTPEG